MTDRAKVRRFLLFSFAGSWALALLVFLAKDWVGNLGILPIYIVYMWVPGLVALVLQRGAEGGVAGSLGLTLRPNRFYLVAWLVPPVYALATFGISLLLPGVDFSADLSGMVARLEGTLPPEQVEALRRQIADLPAIGLLSFVQALIAGPTINAVAALGEELGWRGLLYRELKHLGLWRASLVIGVVWGVWHAPLILQGHNYPLHPVAGVFMMTGWCLLLTPIHVWLRAKSGSVLAPAIFHGSLNAWGGIAVMYVAGGGDLLAGVTGLAGFLALLPTLVLVAARPVDLTT